MNCRDWEERLALYQGGDLPRHEAVQVERHLADCLGCQLFHSGLKEAQELLQELHREPLAPAHFAAVRARVLSELERERRPAGQTITSGLLAFWRSGWGLGFAEVAAALLVMLVARPVLPPVRQPSKQVPAVSGKAVAPAVLPPVSPNPNEASPVRAGTQGAHVTRRIRPRQTHAQSPEPVLIKMVPDNPDVVIYWIADTRGD
jgi:hypothetical protein